MTYAWSFSYILSNIAVWGQSRLGFSFRLVLPPKTYLGLICLIPVLGDILMNPSMNQK